MGNVMNMGYGAPVDAAEAPIQNDYIQRLSAADLKRYTEGFRRVCRVESDNGASAVGGGQLPPLPPAATKPSRRAGNNSVNPMGVGIANGSGSAGLSKKLFRNKLLSAFPLIPHSLSDRLFEVLDTDQRGELGVEVVLRGIALLKHGTRDEHLQLLFTIYDLDGTGLVARDVLERFMDVVYGRKKARSSTTVAFLNRVFNRRTTLTIDEFREIAEEKDADGQAVLLQWLYALSDRIGRVDDEQIVELEKQYNPVVIRHRIAETTLFSTNEVSTLEKQFHKLFDTKGGASNRIPTEQFIDLMARHLAPRHVLEKACEQERLTVPGMVLFDEFCQIISDYCRGMVEVKCRRLFELYSDVIAGENAKFISREALDELLKPYDDVQNPLDEVSKLNGHSQHHSKQDGTGSTSGAPWSETEFIEWATGSKTVVYMLNHMAFAACILFGINPDSAFLERKIVESHWIEATRDVVVGQTWNLLASKWWLQWCKFVGLDDASGTPRATQLCIPQVPREAVWSEDSNGDDDASTQAPYTSRPGTIANWSLLKRSGSRRLKEKLIIGRDFHLVPASVYAVLSQWYSGGPDLTRAVIELPNGVKQVELFPLILRVAKVDSSSGGVILSGEEVLLSTMSTVEGLLHATCKALLLTKYVEKARLWFFDENRPDHKFRLRNNRPKDLQRLTQSCVFLVEVRDEDGSWPLSQSASDGHTIDDEDDDSVDAIETPSKRSGDATHPPQLIRRTSEICSRGNLEALTTLGSTKNATGAKDGSIKPSTVVEEEGLATARTLKRRFSRNAFTGSGLVGLDNLGNTCYMSSALQCMSHTRLLVDYFKNEEYLHDINLHNRDGTNGKLAVAFGELLRVLWTSEKKRFAPSEFKRVLARFNPQFSGSDQHDAQELLACLLSGLSEDLNRIVKKPYIEQPDSDGRCDTVVANEWWQNHSKREFSVIVALFTGQYKSLLECSVCHYESARFEPFTFLQLSLPESSFRSIVVTVIFNNGRVPMKYSVRVRNEGCVKDVQDEVADLIRRMDKRDGIPPREEIHVVLARVSTLHTVEAILEPKTPLVRIHERDQLTAYELDDLPKDVVLKMPLLSFTDGSKGLTSQQHEASSPTEQSDSGVTDDAESTEETASPTGSERQTGDVDVHENGDAAEPEADHPPFKFGTSVYVRVEKTRDFLAARVIGGSTKNGPTVDVAYPSGVRRYHIPLSKVLERRRDEAFVFLVHRRVERSMNSFAEAHITRLFGAPLALRISLRTTTNFDLYMLVWNRLHRIFNWHTPPTAESMESMLRTRPEKDDEDQQRQLKRTGLSTVALGRHLAWTNYGFSLRMVTSHGIGCSRCEWIEGCLGCLIIPSPSTVIELTAEETIAIDWDIRTLKEEYDPIQASKIDTHESVQKNYRLDNMPLNIHRCLDMFTAKEHINEAYCGRCKTHRPATKTMDLWRLPPILVIHLKRFCFTQTSRRKLHHLVDFPLTGLRLEDFVAKKRVPKRFHDSGLVYWQFLGGKLMASNEKPAGSEQADTGEASSTTKSTSNGQSSPTSTLMEAPATAAERADESFLYDLYAVVNHVGALGAGHYFAYVLSEEDNKWKCFNDHQCKEIDAKEVVSSSAYILFYRRRDMKNVPIETLFPPIRRKKANVEEGDESADDDQARVEELVEQTKAATHGSGCVIS